MLARGTKILKIFVPRASIVSPYSKRKIFPDIPWSICVLLTSH